jgi:hypothetical protein
MALVAGCPCCSHELLIPDDADPFAWAKCTSCDALFQVQDADARQVNKLVLVDAESLPSEPEREGEAVRSERVEAGSLGPTRTVTMASSPTLGEIEARDERFGFGLNESNGDDSLKLTPNEPSTPSMPTIDDLLPAISASWEEEESSSGLESPVTAEAAVEALAETPAIEPPVSESLEAAAERLEEWFHSAKTVAEVPPFVLEATSPSEPVAAANEVAELTQLPSGEEVAEQVAGQDQEPVSPEWIEPSTAIDATARTIDDVAFPSAFGRPDTTVEFSGKMLAGDSADTDFELAPTAERNESVPTWDDSEHMERLLAGNNGVPTDEQAPQYGDEDHPFIHAELFAPSSGIRRRRPSSMARMLIGVIAFGVIGLAIGYYILLAWRGTEGDVLNLAQFLPRAILPSEFSEAAYADDKSAMTGEAEQVDQARFDVPLAESDTKLDEPTPLAPPAAMPITEVVAPHVAGAPLYSVDECAVALQAAKEAQLGLVTGRLSDGAAVRRAKGISFSLLADLAQKATFVDAAARPTSVAPLQQETETLFRETLSMADIRGEVGRIVPLWIGSKHRTHGGIFFAGTVLSDATKGEVVECRIDLEAGEPLTILVPPALAGKLQGSGRPLGFVGSIVDRPADSVSGYNGDAAQAVWIGQVIPLE